MNGPKGPAEHRVLQAIARRYKRQGYQVTVPAEGVPLPSFLEGFAPDLIAESKHDRVVIEVKQNEALRGSNDLQAIAERVSREPGWRFELVTVPSIKNVSVPAADRLESIARNARAAMRAGLADAAYAYAWTVIEVLLTDLALQNELNAMKKPVTQLARDLVSMGVISQETMHAIEKARAIRNQVIHAEGTSEPTVADVEGLLALGQHLREELASAEPT